MDTTTNTSDSIITRSYKEYYQVILTYITYRITHRYEAEDLTQDVFVRLLDYKQMLRPDTVKYFLFTIARNIVIDYIRRYYEKQEINSYIYDSFSISTKGYLLMNKIIYNFGRIRAFHDVQEIGGFLPSYNLDSVH